MFQLNSYAPPQRMVVLVAWVKVGEQGDIEKEQMVFDVLGIINLIAPGDDNETFSQDVQIVVDGELVTLAQASKQIFPENHEYYIVVCDWPKHMDEEKLAPHLEVLAQEVEESIELDNN